jgi:hypothetical protein
MCKETPRFSIGKTKRQGQRKKPLQSHLYVEDCLGDGSFFESQA